MSLAALGASVNISMRSLVFHRRNWKWPAVSLLFFIMTGIQTSVCVLCPTPRLYLHSKFRSWSTLLTPVKVVISSPLAGREIDLSSPILQQMYNANDLDVCKKSGTSYFIQYSGTVSRSSLGRDGAVYGGVPQSGYANGQSYLGLPAAVSLLDWGFNVSTRRKFS
jgi:hypothetical protein